MKRIGIVAVFAVAVVISGVQLLQTASGGVLNDPLPAPEFTHTDRADWINSPPLRLSDLRGKVVLVDFWAFDCWNCYRSFPWLKSLEARLEPRGLEVIGVHSPELPEEHVLARLKAKVRQFGLADPIMVDNDFSYWHAMHNRYWPAFYIIDKSGNIRAEFVGETHAGDHQARAIESIITYLLNQPS